MDTVFTNRLKRQGYLFAASLILLWVLVISFMGLRLWLMLDGGDDVTTDVESVILFDDLFFIIAAVITCVVSLIAFVVARLYRSLRASSAAINYEHNIALEQEQEKIRIKRQLSNNINHELKTPICSILGYLEMILGNEDLDMATTRKFIQKSYDQAERLRHLMTDLSTITRIDEASSMIERETIDLNSIIESVIDDTTLQAKERNIEVIDRITTPLKIEGNNSLLYSIFRNLVDNAIAYSGGRRVTIELVAEDSTHLHLVVQDNGIGVEQRHLPHLFERFYRVDKGRSRKAGGTGLGLSIVKNAVLFHNGQIEARTSRNGGLEFAFSLSKKSTSEEVIETPLDPSIEP